MTGTRTFKYVTIAACIWWSSGLDLAPAERVAIKNSILGLFGKENRPRSSMFSHIMRNASSAKQYMMNLYEQTKLLEEQEIADLSVHLNGTMNVVNEADTIVSFVNNVYTPRPNASDVTGSMYFDVSSNFVIEKSLAANLRIYLDVDKKVVRDHSLIITVYQIVFPRQKGIFLASSTVNAAVSQWHKFDVLKASLVWKESPESNNGVLLVCETIDRRVKTLDECGIVNFDGDVKYRPFLVSFFQSGDEEETFAQRIHQPMMQLKLHRRSRRSLNTLLSQAHKYSGNFKGGGITHSNYSEKQLKDRCNRHPLYIGFKDLGWSDWIIAPEGYKGGYCGGDCSFPLDSTVKASYHAIIQSLVNMMYPDKIPKPCCAPNKLKSLQVLFLDERNNVIMKRYGNMVVHHCGCQ